MAYKIQETIGVQYCIVLVIPGPVIITLHLCIYWMIGEFFYSISGYLSPYGYFPMFSPKVSTPGLKLFNGRTSTEMLVLISSLNKLIGWT